MKHITTYSSMKFIFAIFIALLFLYNCKQEKTGQPIVLNENVSNIIYFEILKSKVYTAAHNSDLKLAVTDSLTFESFKQY